MKNRKKIMTGMLVCTIVISNISLLANAAGVSNKEKEEVIYIMLDANGNTDSINVVNVFGKGDVIDYGDYSTVKMLTSTTPISQSGDEITFTSDSDRIYYQGTLENTQIPWNIEITYQLDGKTITADELAGASGALEIHMQITQNALCKENFYEGYALQTALTLQTNKCKNIVADGATLANVGADKQISYTVLPGKGLDTTIATDVTDFEMDAITINGIKLDLNIDIENTELMDQVTEIMDASSKLNDGASELKEGTNKLTEGSSNLKNGVDSLYNGAATLQTNLSYEKYKAAMNQNGLNLEQLVAGNTQIIATLSAQISELQTTISQLKSIPGYENNVEYATKVATCEAQVSSLKSIVTLLTGNNAAIGGTETYLNTVSTGMDSLVNGLDTVKTSYETFDTGMETYTAGVETLANGTSEFYEKTADMNVQIQNQIDEMMDSISGDEVETVSFVSDKNTNVDSVQFVIKTTAIEKAEVKIQEEQSDVKMNFWQKLLHLFGLNDEMKNK